MVTVTIKHGTLTGAEANPNVLVDGPKWDAAHTVTGLENVLIEASGKPFVILTTGQSNFVQTPAFTWTPNSNALLWNFSGVDGNVGTAYAALSGTTINVVTKLASDIADANLTRPVFLINISFDSQPISHWLSGASSPDVYQNILNNITAALAAAGVSQIDLFCWWQGEADTASLNTSYVANHATMMARFLGNTWFPQETPVLIFGTGSTATTASANADAVNDFLLAVVNADPDKRRYVYTASLPSAYWTGVHMTGQGYFSAGAMSASAFLNGTGRNSLKNIVVDPASGNVNIGGYGIPDSLLTVNANTGAAVAPLAGTNLHVVGADGASDFITMDAYGAQAAVLARFARGTQAAKLPPNNGDTLAAFGHQAWDVTGYFTGVNIQSRATETWSSTAHGAEFAIRTTPNTTTVVTDALIVKNSGGVAVGSSAADPGVGNLNLGGGSLLNNGTSPIGTGAYVRASALTNGLFVVDRNGTNQTGLTAATYNKISFTNEVKDAEGWFDNVTNFRYTPLVAGTYYFALQAASAYGTSGETCQAVIRKNGANFKGGLYIAVTGISSGTGTFNSTVFAAIDMNGTTDYVEGFLYLPASITTLNGVTANTHFQGWRVGA